MRHVDKLLDIIKEVCILKAGEYSFDIATHQFPELASMVEVKLEEFESIAQQAYSLQRMCVCVCVQ